MVKRTDLIMSLAIGELVALLMLAVSRNIALPAAVYRLLPWLPLVFPVFTFLIIAAGTVAGRRLPVVYQFTKFMLVGGMNFLIDLGVLNFLIAATGIASGFYAVAFKAAAFLVAVVSSFLGNKFWTFRALSVEHAGLQFAGFFMVSAVGLLINTGMFTLLNDGIGPSGGIPPATWANVSAVGATLVVLLWNFLGYKFFVFRKAQK